MLGFYIFEAMHLGLIGYPLSNSFSKTYFEKLFVRNGLSGYTYNNFPIQNIAELSELLNTYQLSGLNVTIPHKISVIDYLTELDESAREAGAVNCIKIKGDKLTGYNTDVYGFRESLLPLLQPWHQQALILGNGGAARAVISALKQLGIQWRVVSRQVMENTNHELIGYNDLDKTCVRSHQLIINATPVGMHPHSDEALVFPYSYLTDKHLVYDLIYLPDETLFLTNAKAQGATIKNGLEMLHLQAQRSWEIWNE
jgi:shikimate dehydrogenase